MPVHGGWRAVAVRSDRPVPLPARRLRRRLDLFWIRALWRMCPPLNIRAAADAWPWCRTPPALFLLTATAKASPRSARQGRFYLPPVAATASHVTGGCRRARRAVGTPVRALLPWPRAWAWAGSRASTCRRRPRARRAQCTATATQLFGVCHRLALCWRSGLWLALSNCCCVRASACGAMMATN